MFFPRRKYIFRGQGVESWKLISSFDRAYGMMGFEERKKAEEYLLRKFKKLCIDWKEMKQLENYDIDQIRAIGQHFNLPTRLLIGHIASTLQLFLLFLTHVSHKMMWQYGCLIQVMKHGMLMM